jgi:hypothetical protein
LNNGTSNFARCVRERRHRCRLPGSTPGHRPWRERHLRISLHIGRVPRRRRLCVHTDGRW